MEDRERFTKFASIVSFGILTSRVLGYVRDILIAYNFSETMRGLFFAAWLVPNLTRRLLGEGALSAAFIPVFSSSLAKSKESASELASIILNLLIVVSVTITIIGIALSPFISTIIAPGFVKIGLIPLMSKLLAILFPYLPLVCVSALIMGILNSLSKFTAPAIAPAMLNISFIFFLLFICKRLSEPVIGLGYAVLVGGLLQIAFQLLPLCRSCIEYVPRISISHPQVIEIGKRMAPTLVGLSVIQVNMAIDTILASLIGPGAVSALYYANRLIQLPLALFGISVGMVALPTISSYIAEKREKDAKATLSWSLRLIAVINIPAAIGLMVLGRQIVQLLFEYGEFTQKDTISCYFALFFFSLGLLFYSGIRPFVSYFYALGDTKTPVKVAVVAMLSNIALNLIFIKPLEEGGIAFATCLSAGINLSLLAFLLRERIGGLNLIGVAKTLLKSSVSSSIMGVVLLCFIKTTPYLSLQVAGGIFLSIFVYAICAKIFRISEVTAIFKMFRC
jgi:putative peptidoglycan lipid II flippase